MNDTVAIYGYTTSKTSDGVLKKTWTIAETIVTDVQPAGLTQAQLQQYGLSNIAADLKKVFTMGSDVNIKVGNRALVNGADWYDIFATNNWPVHQENLFKPCVGGT